MAAVLESLIFLVIESTQLEYETFLLPHIRSDMRNLRFLTTILLRPLFGGPKTVQASVTLLEQLPFYIDKSGVAVLYQDILPMLYLALESSMSQVLTNQSTAGSALTNQKPGFKPTMSQVQMAAVSIVPAILDYLDDGVIRNQLLPRARMVHTTNGADVKIVLSLLACIAKVGGN